MKLIDCKDFDKSAGTIRNIYISICRTYLSKLDKHQSLGLKQLQDKLDLSLDDISDLLNTIILSEDGFLNTPENNRNSMILRYLEYGGQDVRPIHLLSLSKKRLYKILYERR